MSPQSADRDAEPHDQATVRKVTFLSLPRGWADTLSSYSQPDRQQTKLMIRGRRH